MAISSIRAIFQCDVQKVWDIVTSLEQYSWRSDISKIKVLSEKRFIEYTRDGYQTGFVITAMEPLKRYEFDMENENMSGHWTGIFTKTSEGTIVDFTEDVKAKKLIMKPFVGAYLKKQQKAYIRDLREELKE